MSDSAVQYWREQGITEGAFGSFLGDAEEVLHELALAAWSATQELEEDHPGLTDVLFANDSKDDTTTISGPTLRLVIYDSDNDLAAAGLNPEQIANMPHGKPHYDRSTLGLLSYGSSDDVFGILPGEKSGDTARLTQLKYNEGRAHLFAGLGWSALYPSSPYKPLEHGIFRVKHLAAHTVREAAVLLARPICIDESTPGVAQRLYTESELADLRQKAMQVAA